VSNRKGKVEMKAIAIAVVLLTSLFNCNGGKVGDVDKDIHSGCTERATITDFTGLDGCGLMLVLDDGTRLNPERRVYIQAPKREDDPLYYFEMKAGEKVKISYKETGGADACMAGKRVFITCITKLETE